MTKEQRYIKECIAILSSIKDPKLLEAFLVDILTPVEMGEVAKRWQIVLKLERGESQRQIAKDLGVGIATVTRGSKELANKKGGFRQVLDMYNKKK